MTVHIFNVDDAIRHGMEKAVVLQNMRFWLDKNKANNTNLHDGYYWTYNSAEAFFKLFPYLKSAKVIQRLLKSMVEDGLLLAGNYNKKGYDRTKWYSMPEYFIESLDVSHCSEMTNAIVKTDQCNSQKRPMDCSEMTNGLVKTVQPIPYVNTDTKPYVNTDTKTLSPVAAKEPKADTATQTANSLVDFWNDNRPVKSAVKVPVWSKVIKTRLKTFTADEIKQAMLHVINDSWYQSKNQVLIKNIIDSDKRCAEVLEKSNQPANQQSANNQTQGNNNANHQPANNQYQQQPKQSQADIYANNIDAQLAAEAEREARQGEYS